MATRLLDRMLARKGKIRSDLHPSSNIAKRLKAFGVQPSKELDRIVALPRRDWMAEDVSFLQDELTDWLKQPEGTQRFRPAQAIMLSELHDLRGIVGIILVGGGKTLWSYVAPLVLDSVRPVLFVPGSLEGKTLSDFEDLSPHWQTHPDYPILTYSKLSRESGRDALFDLQPDLIVADEVHKLKDQSTSTCRHVSQYLEEYPDTIFCGVSGTITNRSLLDYHHLLRWALGPMHMPVPVSKNEVTMWARALDEKLRGGLRVSPGALKVFVPGAESVSLAEARKGYSQRLTSTPGVVATKASDVDASLVGSFWDPQICVEIQGYLDHLLAEGETPDGEVCREAVDVWRHARELVCGFYYRWEPKPPKVWLEARRAWFRFVREQLGLFEAGLSSPLQVANACKRGYLHSGHHYENWVRVKDSYTKKNVPVWCDTSVLQQVLDRLPKEPTLIWVEQNATGRKLAEMSGLPFFGRKGLDENGRYIETLKGKQTVIVSIMSNFQGRNLQAWSHNSIVSLPPNGALLEQLFGRTHREGQEADEVYYDIMLGSEAIREGVRQALRDARYIEQTTQTPQKILLAGLRLGSSTAPTKTKAKTETSS